MVETKQTSQQDNSSYIPAIRDKTLMDPSVAGPFRGNARRETANGIANLRATAAEMGIKLVELRTKFPMLTNHSGALGKNANYNDLHAAAAKDDAVMIVTLLRARGCKEEDLIATGLVRDKSGTIEDRPEVLIGPKVRGRYVYKGSQGVLETFHEKYGLISNVPESCPIQLMKEGLQLIALLKQVPEIERSRERNPKPVIDKPKEEEKFGEPVKLEDATVEVSDHTYTKGTCTADVETPPDGGVVRNREGHSLLAPLAAGFVFGGVGGHEGINKCINVIKKECLDASGLGGGGEGTTSAPGGVIPNVPSTL